VKSSHDHRSPKAVCFKSRPAVSSSRSGRLGIHAPASGFTSSDVTEEPMILVLINVLIIVVFGALIFYLIDRFVRDGRLANLLKILVALICLAAILVRLLPALGVSL
jgi:hypothetical protein